MSVNSEATGAAESSKKSGVTSAHRFYVDNLPYACDWKGLKEWVRKLASQECYTEVMLDKDGKRLGLGLIEVRLTPDGADECLNKLANQEMDGRKVVVRKMSNADSAKLTALRKASRQQPSMPPMPPPPMYPPGPGNPMLPLGRPINIYDIQEVKDFLRIEGIVTNRVFVTNIPFDVDERRLHSVMSVAGNVKDITLLREKGSGQSRGCAEVEYSCELEALQAVSMLNEAMYEDRKLAVRIDQKPPLQKTFNRPADIPRGLSNVGVGFGKSGESMKSLEMAQNLPRLLALLNVPSSSGAPPMPPSHASRPAVDPKVQVQTLLANALNEVQKSKRDYHDDYPQHGDYRSSYRARSRSPSAYMRRPRSPSPEQYGLAPPPPVRDSSSRPMHAYPSHSNGSVGSGQAQPAPISEYYTSRNGGGMKTEPGFTGAMPVAMPGSMVAKSVPHDGTAVIVKGLASETSWQQLKERFADVGDVRFADIEYVAGDNTTCNGFGVVRFMSGDVAQRAVRLLDNAQLNNRQINVTVLQ